LDEPVKKENFCTADTAASYAPPLPTGAEMAKRGVIMFHDAGLPMKIPDEYI
jgi:hypothetical protein